MDLTDADDEESSSIGRAEHPLYQGADAYEDVWAIESEAGIHSVAFLSNGGWYDVRRHPVRGHYQLLLVTFMVDV